MDNQWQPIETAPKDGTRFIGRSSYAERYTGKLKSHRRITRWGKTSHVPLYGWTHGRDVENIDLWEPTHWTPLPTRDRNPGGQSVVKTETPAPSAGKRPSR